MREINISRIQMQASTDLATAKQNFEGRLNVLEKDLLFHKVELQDRNNQIEDLHKERTRVRTLTRIQFGLIKSRVKKRLEKVVKRVRK